MTAYAKSLGKSRAGEISFTTVADYSKFLKAHSAESGSYLIKNSQGQETLVNIENAVEQEVKRLASEGTVLDGNDIAALKAKTLRNLKLAQGE